MVAWIAALAIAWASAGIAPLRDALGGAAQPGDFATDFVPAARWWRGQVGPVGVATGNAEAAAWGVAPYADVGVPFGAHPPPAVVAVGALVPLGFAAAALTWLALSLACLAFLAWILVDAVGADGAIAANRRAWRAALVFIVLVAWPPVLHDLEKGQWSLIIAALLAAAWRSARRGHPGRAGVAVAVAGLFKVMPFLVLPAVARRAGQRRRALGGAAAVVLLAIVGSTIALGPGAWPAFLTAAPVNTRGWQTGPANTLSLWGMLARLLVGGPYAHPLMHAAQESWWLARGAWAAGAAGLIGVTLWAAHDSEVPSCADPSAPLPRTPGADAGQRQDARFDATFSAWAILAVVLGPLSWTHTATWLLLPAALLARVPSPNARHRLPELTSSALGRPVARTQGVWAVSLVLLSVPRHTLFLLAGFASTAPSSAEASLGSGAEAVTPGGGLWLAVHLVGALGLLFVALDHRFRLRAVAPSPLMSGKIGE